MLPNIRTDVWHPRTILNAAAAWVASALLLLTAASLIVTRVNAGEAAIGYISSALSFFTAFSAGAVVGREGSGGVVYQAMLTAAVLVTVLLTVGFIVEGAELESSGVLSVVSFSFAGCLTGAILWGGKKGRSHKKRYRR